MSNTDFIDTVKSLRKKAINTIENGGVSQSYGADISKVTELLNTALATELVCVLRYKNHSFRAKMLGAKIAADEFADHARQELEHAEKLADRLTQLGMVPKMSPDYLSKNSHAEYKNCDTVADMIHENHIAEHIAIDNYHEIIRYIKDRDPTTRRLLEDILAAEEKHADDMQDLKAEYNIN